MLQVAILGGYASESQRLFSAMTVAPSGQRRNLIDRTIKAMKSNGAWDALDVLYLAGAADEQAGQLNWKNPAAFTCVGAGTYTFTADRGVAGNGVDGYWDTNFNPTTAGLQFAQNNAHMGMYCLTNVSTGNRACGNTASTICPRTVNDMQAVANATTADTVALPVNTSVGHILWQRNNSANFDVYKNGALVSNVTRVSSAPTNANFGICARLGATSFHTVQIAAFHAGAPLTTGQSAALYAALLAYLQGVGAQ